MDFCYYSHNSLLHRRLVEHKEVKQHRQDYTARYRKLGHKQGRLDFWADVLSVTRLIAQQQRAWFLCGLLRILWYAEVSLHRTYKKLAQLALRPWLCCYCDAVLLWPIDGTLTAWSCTTAWLPTERLHLRGLNKLYFMPGLRRFLH